MGALQKIYPPCKYCRETRSLGIFGHEEVGMKQRIRVVAVIKEGDSILVLKRSLGRMESEPIWELLTGKIRFGDQPEEAMMNAVYDQLGVRAKKIRLIDTITFISLSGVSQTSNLYIVYEVALAKGEKIDLGDRYTAYNYANTEKLNSLMIEEASQTVLEIEVNQQKIDALGTEKSQLDFRKTANSATIYVDGASRGNPGPSGIGYYIVDADGRELKRGGEFIGFATSRVAEYFALKEGCEQALELGLSSVRIVGDNLMMINQMNGIYKVKNADLLTIYQDVQKMIKKFENVAFIHVRREQNSQADEEANLAIDRNFGEK